MAAYSSSARGPAHREGFTLAEMSFVLIIIGLVIVMVYPALTVVRTANQKMVTQSNLQALMRATAAYVQANGCLPCPASPVAPGLKTADFGKSNTSPAGAACGACAASTNNFANQGIVPFVSLGLPQSMAKDGWGHWITMRVDPSLTTLPANPVGCSGTACSVFVPPWSECTESDYANNTSENIVCLSENGPPVGYSTKGFCRYHPTSQPLLVKTPGGAEQRAAVVFISHGATGYGSYNAAPKKAGFLVPFSAEYPPCTGVSGFAQCNSAQRDLALIYDTPTIPLDSDPFDDVLAYADRNTLVSMLGTGSCNTRW